MVGRARRRLAEAITGSWDEERARYSRLVPPGDELRDLAGRLRDGAREVRELRPALPADAEPVAVAADGDGDAGAAAAPAATSPAPAPAPAPSGWGANR